MQAGSQAGTARQTSMASMQTERWGVSGALQHVAVKQGPQLAALYWQMWLAGGDGMGCGYELRYLGCVWCTCGFD